MVVVAVILIGFVLPGIINPINIIVTGKNLDTALERYGDFHVDYIANIHINVKNEGRSGYATVYVKAKQEGYCSWTKSQLIYLDSGESKELMFRFSEVDWWIEKRFAIPITYDVWILYLKTFEHPAF